MSGRDIVYAAETVQLIQSLDQQQSLDADAPPWLVVSSFVNPHDIVLYGALAARLPDFRFDVEPMPAVPPPPTRHESLSTKPNCQASYRDLYPIALQPIINEPFYRQLYYQLQKNVDREMHKVIDALARSSFYDNTIIIFTSDHGDLLGSHGNLHQKWYCAYEEMLHVPFIIHNRTLFPGYNETHTPTSHLDLLPTMLGLADADIPAIHASLQNQFVEARPLVGRNLAPYIVKEPAISIPAEPIYFMSDDDATRGQHQISPIGVRYQSVVQPNHIETVLAQLSRNGKTELWKLSRYFDNPQFWSDPGVKDVITQPEGAQGAGCPSLESKRSPALIS